MGLLDNFLEYELYSDWNRFTISLRDKYTREVEYNFYDEGLKGVVLRKQKVSERGD